MSSYEYTCQVSGYTPAFQSQGTGVYGQSDYTSNSTPNISTGGGHTKNCIRTTAPTISVNGCSVRNSSYFISNCKGYSNFGRHR